MHKWYVVQVLSGQEKKVLKAIKENQNSGGVDELIGEIILPVENVAEVKQGEQKIREKLLWPGYLLVKANLTDLAWHYIKDTNGVIGFLGGGKPNSLTDREVEEILNDLYKKKEEVVHKYDIDIGDQVKITDGVFVNFTGTVTEIFQEKGRLSVLVSIFGRDTRVDDLEFWQVEKISND